MTKGNVTPRGMMQRIVPLVLFGAMAGAPPALAQKTRATPVETELKILIAEDERRWDDELAALLQSPDAKTRRRAALAAGRIGNARAVPLLAELLARDPDESVRVMAAFALGETEAPAALRPLLDALKPHAPPVLRARIVEAIGKCAAALPESAAALKAEAGAAILGTLEEERAKETPDRDTVLLALTAALRARPANSGPALAAFLTSPDPRVRADAANAIARLRLKDSVATLRKLLDDTDPIVRANAARALGAAEDRESVEALLRLATGDADPRVRVSAIRALAAIKDAQAASTLLNRGEDLWAAWQKKNARQQSFAIDAEISELLEIAATLGRQLEGSSNAPAVNWLSNIRSKAHFSLPEVEIAFARIAPAKYIKATLNSFAWSDTLGLSGLSCGDCTPAVAMGLGETAQRLADFPEAQRGELTRVALARLRLHIQTIFPAEPPKKRIPASSGTESLRAYAAFRPEDLRSVLLRRLTESDINIRATAALLLGDQPADKDIQWALIAALPVALRDIDNDAALAILNALAKQKTAEAIEAIKTALTAKDYLVRWRAAALLRAAGVADAKAQPETVVSRNKLADYRRALARADKKVTARVETSQGTFVIELLSEDAPLTVDNFVELAKKKYFDGIRFHRVVPNFVIQGGDPTGTGSGGPGYSIRCEINMQPYERGAVGMALSGKDTGGSQWFVTHSPQPHLDGGYTVFGRVISGMDVVDRIARGDRILRITVREHR
ncbi:MAG TPA: peptidylprolyl isomerase [Candidatus Nitrosotenuis sp.]|nr:peptidylprolyl isomerase [Candidatus Nitrosotenuis sp.]